MTLDTVTYSALLRGIPQADTAIRSAKEINMPLPVIAELRYGFARGSKQHQNEQTLQRFLAQPQILILVPTIKTTELYADLQLLCVNKGKALSQNDIWIAALSQEANDILVTFDQDFRVFSEVLGKKLLILDY
jgi:predicted nucleic acid-binding protein